MILNFAGLMRTRWTASTATSDWLKSKKPNANPVPGFTAIGLSAANAPLATISATPNMNDRLLLTVFMVPLQLDFRISAVEAGASFRFQNIIKKLQERLPG